MENKCALIVTLKNWDHYNRQVNEENCTLIFHTTHRIGYGYEYMYFSVHVHTVFEQNSITFFVAIRKTVDDGSQTSFSTLKH